MSRGAIKVFISYSHDDEVLREELEKHLALLRREGRIHTWHDRKILAGEEWRGQIDKRLEAADVILLLVSASFIASDYCWDVETRRALERHAVGDAKVIPVIVRSCDWRAAPFAEHQSLPRDSKPVTTWSDRDQAWLDVTQGVREVIATLGTRSDKTERQPPRLRHPDETTHHLSQRLKKLFRRRKELTIAGQDAQAIEGEILDVRRLLRKGPQLRVGEILHDGRYELLGVIGQGGFATVWKARDQDEEQLVALKVLHGHYVDDRSKRERFFRGARKMAELAHPHIVRVLKASLVDEGWHFFAMEYLGGDNLELAVLRGDLTLRQRFDLLLQIGEALKYAHRRGVVHRDVKPSNILMTPEGLAKLTDFDLVHSTDTTGLTASRAMLGTIQFAAPEALASAGMVGPAADVFSLGSTAVFAVHGERLPWWYFRDQERAIAELNCSSEMKEFLMRATALEPEERFASMKEFCHGLQLMVNVPASSEAVEAGYASKARTGVRLSTRRPRPAEKSSARADTRDTLVLCGGSGAHVGVAFLRLHTLGYNFGLFDREGEPLPFPRIFLVDQDSGDGPPGRETAWELVRHLIAQHPARHDWQRILGMSDPELHCISPLPVGHTRDWFRPPFNTLGNRFDASPIIELFSSESQRQIDYSQSMSGSPAIGALLLRLKEYDERARGLNYDELFGRLFLMRGRILVTGSVAGGTGAAVAPALARQLATENRQVMNVLMLPWFSLEENDLSDKNSAAARRRNRRMSQNTNSALAYNSLSLEDRVAAVLLGAPNEAIHKRPYVGEYRQPALESFIHATAAICGIRHFVDRSAYGAGLYLMAAADNKRLDRHTAIPGGTLKSLADRAATLVSMIKIWEQQLSRSYLGWFAPPVFKVVRKHSDRMRVAEQLNVERVHYEAQLRWLEEVLGITGERRDLSAASLNLRGFASDANTLPLSSHPSPRRVATALFHWAAMRIREEVRFGDSTIGSPAGGVHCGPDISKFLDIHRQVAGELVRVSNVKSQSLLQSLVQPSDLSAESWPHPVAAADFFRHALNQGQPTAFRQLELLLTGLVSGILELEELAHLSADTPLSLEYVVRQYRRQGHPGLAETRLVYPRRDGLVVGFSSAHTLFCPALLSDGELPDRLWNELWDTLSGSSDGAPWQEASEPTDWGAYDLTVRQIRSWLAHLRRSYRADSPPWTRLFSRYRGRDPGVPFGFGRTLSVFWGSPESAERPLVDVPLPHSQVGAWASPPGTPLISEVELMQRVPELAALIDEKQRRFELVEFEVPDRASAIRGWWAEHLDALVQSGRIFLWSRGEDGGVLIGFVLEGLLNVCRLEDSRVLDLSTVSVATCTPLQQDPMPGSATVSGDIRYPDLPIKGDYLDLVETPGGDHLLAALKRGDEMPLSDFRPRATSDSKGRLVISWKLKLRGLGSPLSIELRLGNDYEPHRAHIMVWPRFRSAAGNGWRAYYVYHHCTDARLHADTLWLDVSSEKIASRLRRRLAESAAYPVSFKAGLEIPSHNGGPPVALSLRNDVNKQEQGLYLVPLTVLPETPIEVGLAIDLGFTKSVAAVRIKSDAPQDVEFLPDLDQEHASRALTLHISEDKDHVEAPFEEGGMLASSLWLPTYRTSGPNGFLPSELLLIQKLSDIRADSIREWQPLSSFLIPSVDVERCDLAEHLLSGFVWSEACSSHQFRGREGELWERYFFMFMELAIAEIVSQGTCAFPREIQFTCIYPLRSSACKLDDFQALLRRVVVGVRRSLGAKLCLQDGVGIYDRSHAKCLQTDRDHFGAVCVVGDLGARNLDIFIKAGSGPAVKFPTVSDGAHIGGDLFLREMARQAGRYLPNDGGWSVGDARSVEIELRAWMLSEGFPRLFGLEAGGRPELREMNLRGFQHASEAASARELLGRYFQLIVEFIARQLVSFLIGSWFPAVEKRHHEELLLSIQLYGDGWRLRYQKESAIATAEAIRNAIRKRCESLWSIMCSHDYLFPGGDRHWAAAKYSFQGSDPIKDVVGRAMPPSEVRWTWHSHPLVDLQVIKSDGSRDLIHWYEKVPLEASGRGILYLSGISPSILLGTPFGREQIEIDELPAGVLRAVNRKLQNEGVIDLDSGSFRAPVAALVWEAIFASPMLWLDDQGIFEPG